jgi:hypothetical protein
MFFPVYALNSKGRVAVSNRAQYTGPHIPLCLYQADAINSQDLTVRDHFRKNL